MVLFNILGQQVSEIVNTTKNAGTYEVTFNGNNLSSGVYYYKINAVSLTNNKEFTNIKKLILLK